MESTKFYKPRLLKLTGKEMDFMFENLVRAYRMGTDPDFDFVAFSSARNIMSRRIALEHTTGGQFNMGPFQISYNFPPATRGNIFPKMPSRSSRNVKGEYGAPGWSYRLLYEFLCEAYNGGVPFIDTYFERVFETRPVYADFTAIYETIQDGINNEQFDIFSQLPLKADGTPDMRFAASKRYMDFKVWQDPIIYQGCERLAKKIRDDIVVCLSTGKIPLRGKGKVSRRTRKIRESFPTLHASQLFYASGKLIRHLNIYVEIGGKGAQAA